MKSFERPFLQQIKIPGRSVSKLTALAEFKGRETLYQSQSPDILEKLTEVAKVESAESSNRIEGVKVSHKRCEAVVLKNSRPKNRPESEVAGYRDALDLIHQVHEDMPVSANVILQLHSTLYRYTSSRSGHWKLQDNEIVDRLPSGDVHLRFKPVSSILTPDYMERLVGFFNESWQAERLDPLVQIPLFVLDFLCVHPFKDGNGRVSRLLTLLLLYKAGYTVGRYISLERVIEQSKETYYEALFESSKGWHDGKHNPDPWIDYFWGTLIASYKEFESRVGVFRKKGRKTEQISMAIDRYIRPFSIADIRKECPNASIDLIRKILKDLKRTGKIRNQGMGRYSKWVRLI